MSDVIVVGAGVVGAACAYYAARAGLDVTVVDRGPVAGGTTGAGEGNVLVSDKEPGPELDLALLSNRLWRELDRSVGGFEFEAKGGLVVAETADVRLQLADLAAKQGIQHENVPAHALRDLEPHLADGLAGGVLYPQDAQVQPMLAAARLLRHSAGGRGGRLPGGGAVRLRLGVTVTGLLRSGERVSGVRTDQGDLPGGAVVNAAGTWGGRIAALAGVDLPVQPRRGFILVTEPLGEPLIRHKVYTAAYVTNVASDSADLETSAVIEGTPAGTVLIGASRERVGFDRTTSPPVLARLAAQAVALFPVLRDVRVIRSYCGFRPYCPDHLPVIGADPRAPGLYHACGHEGAGIGLAPATGHLLAQLIQGHRPDLDPHPFRPDRFQAEESR
ncbi:FAD-binding oxidoreductase [Nonomuraea glycinis]|jgi:glycine/D-amino acid oxidase-like deaminating enzyme|uniref:Oxidoreductase n=1 Tax=Nonomuraea glycinis TaxID=2047744 RepID=A0A918E5V4_9ACTN|nr:FAD-binding oxidoreductase [Nonomuraea glycinis]MCA2177211.1 FAD-binding oxidoreductase [Nonomuraea glycinis]WSG66655.1 FAD-binding oxidoreductase [Nonomuraea glycinis]GGP08890.1 oxidoreductase [Nonomuraea glycinis]